MKLNQSFPFILLTVLLGSILLGFYFYFVKPVKEDVHNKQFTIETSTEEFLTLEAQLEASSWEDGHFNEMVLVKKLPKNRELSSVIQLLQQAELLTDSTVQSIVFNDYDENIEDSSILLLEPEPQITEENTLDQSGNPEVSSENNEEQTPLDTIPVSEIVETVLPENLNILTFNATIKHKDYYQLLLFLQEVEKNERLIKIDSLDFNLPGEKITSEDLEMITSTIQMTTFYMK